jgi:uncharacterized membrane protein YcaP (DUF421 family)
MEGMFFNSWFALSRTLIAGTIAYIGLIAFLRVSGKRTLSKMNAFDLVVTVAFGSTLATITLSRDVAVAEGLLAMALLIALQFAITWSSVRWRWVRRTVTGEPSLLFHRGQYLDAALRRARVTTEEVRAAIRGAGYTGLDEVEAVVFETDGSFSVLRQNGGADAMLQDVKR